VKRRGVEVVEAQPAVAAGDDQPGALQYAEMLHHPEARHRHVLAQLRSRPGAAGEAVDQRSAGRVGERLPEVGGGFGFPVDEVHVTIWSPVVSGVKPFFS